MSNPDAFPRVVNIPGRVEVNKGMTLRDWFAGQALVALITSECLSEEVLADRCYTIADAMCERRDKL